MNDAAERGQVSDGAAAIYQQFFVPALFGQWPARVAAALALAPGQAVLDVACGTGVMAREAFERVSPGGRVVGLDLNPGMLEVARRGGQDIAWHEGSIDALPFDDGAFDVVTCQFGLMFFPDRAAALAEMWRVLAPGGRLGVATWAAIESSPGYADLYALLEELFGADLAGALEAPFVLGDAAALLNLAARAGLADARVETLAGEARFASLDDWMFTEIRGWTLADAIDDAQFARLLEAARPRLAQYVGADGAVSFAAPAHLLVATKP